MSRVDLLNLFFSLCSPVHDPCLPKDYVSYYFGPVLMEKGFSPLDLSVNIADNINNRLKNSDILTKKILFITLSLRWVEYQKIQ